MTLAQQIRELMGRAIQGPVTFDHDWARIPTIHGKRDKALIPIAYLPKSGIPQRWDKTDEQEANARLIELLLNNAETLAQAVEDAEWRGIESAPRDGTEFLSSGGQGDAGRSYSTRYLSPGPFSTENGKNTEGQRRYQWPDGFYWAGYDGFVGTIFPTHWRPLPTPPTKEDQNDDAG